MQNGWRIGDEGMQALGSCQAPLRHLNMKGCRLVTNAGLAALVALNHLTHLSLQASESCLCVDLHVQCIPPSLPLPAPHLSIQHECTTRLEL